MKKMVQKIKDKFEHVTGDALRRYNSILLTAVAGLVSFAIYFLIKIDNKVDYSFDHGKQQEQINVRFHEKFNELYEQDKQFREADEKQDARISEISVRLWTHQLDEYQRIGRIETLISRYHEPQN